MALQGSVLLLLYVNFLKTKFQEKYKFLVLVNAKIEIPKTTCFLLKACMKNFLNQVHDFPVTIFYMTSSAMYNHGTHPVYGSR